MKCVRSSSTALSRPQAQASTKSESSAPAGALVLERCARTALSWTEKSREALVDACGLSVIGVSPHASCAIITARNYRSPPECEDPTEPDVDHSAQENESDEYYADDHGGNCNRRHQQALVFDQRREKSGLKRRSVNIDGLDRVIDDRTNGLGIVEPDHSVSAEQLGLREMSST